MSIIPKYFQEILSIIMKCPFCGHQENHKHGKTSNVLNDIIVLNAYKLSPILLTLFTTGEKLDMKKIPMVLQAHVEVSSLRGTS